MPGHVHANTPSMAGTELDIQINVRAGSEWILCDNPRVTLAHTECVSGPGPCGVPLVSAPVVLYFKAAARGWRQDPAAPLSTPREHDQADFEALTPILTQRQRSWLRSAIGAHDPDHPWLRRLAGGSGT